MIELVIPARRRDLGGFEVGRVLPCAKRRMVGPFIFFDHMGPVVLPADVPRRTDVRPHPHIGLSTLTYLFAGEIVHRDSLGCYQVIRPGEVNWMTAGRGVSHSERFDTMRESGGELDGVQAWIALPQEQEEIEPDFVHFDAHELPKRELDGAVVRLIAGSALGLRGPVRTHSPLFYVHASLKPGARLDMDAQYAERAAYIARGRVQIDGELYDANQMVVFAAAAAPALTAVEHSSVMLLGGEPIGARHIWWNFVSSSSARIDQAKADWKDGRFALPVGDEDEFIPLPEDPPPPPEPMS
ncbi:MAG: pirin family protein [Steroidobacteraceae bacterium]|jgi:redox-sensitive bicupin YhaK (pirin superfamily)|nr:pirin family protein [Steroidobacteraceae bacterium]